MRAVATHCARDQDRSRRRHDSRLATSAALKVEEAVTDDIGQTANDEYITQGNTTTKKVATRANRSSWLSCTWTRVAQGLHANLRRTLPPKSAAPRDFASCALIRRSACRSKNQLVCSVCLSLQAFFLLRIHSSLCRGTLLLIRTSS